MDPKEAEAHLKALVGNDPENQADMHAQMLEDFAQEDEAIEALTESIVWQICKDGGMAAPSAETYERARKIAIRQIRKLE